MHDTDTILLKFVLRIDENQESLMLTRPIVQFTKMMTVKTIKTELFFLTFLMHVVLCFLPISAQPLVVLVCRCEM